MTIEETKILHDLESELYKKSQSTKASGQAAYIDASIMLLDALKSIRKLKEKQHDTV